jgi:general secretion pathway protein B
LSYILDALKKSDSERQQRQGPTLATVQSPHFFSQGRSRSSLPLLLGSMFAVLLVIAVGCYQMGYLIWQLPGERAAQSLQVPVVESHPVDAGTAAAEPLAESQVNPAAGVSGVESTLSESSRDFDLATGPESSAEVSSPAIPELWQLPASLREGIPQLDFSLHVYSTRIDQRSIIINNRMMREGESVTPQLTLSAITPDGVVMRYRSAYFRVSIVDSW